MTTWENLCGAGQIDRHHFRVIKNRVYSAFWGFAMYVCTGSVRTYIAKRRNPLIYRILAVPVLGTAKLTARFGMKAKASVIRRPLSGRVRMSCFGAVDKL